MDPNPLCLVEFSFCGFLYTHSYWLCLSWTSILTVVLQLQGHHPSSTCCILPHLSAFAHITPSAWTALPPSHSSPTWWNPMYLRRSPIQPIPTQQMAHKRCLINVKIMSQCTSPFNPFIAFVALHWIFFFLMAELSPLRA